MIANVVFSVLLKSLLLDVFPLKGMWTLYDVAVVFGYNDTIT